MNTTDCIFCKIVRGEIPCEKLYEDDDLLAFEDANPAAPVHFLVIPREHIETLDDVEERHKAMLGKMMLVATKIARDKGIGATGYRQVINCRKSGGQVVFHLHLHIMGGRDMRQMG